MLIWELVVSEVMEEALDNDLSQTRPTLLYPGAHEKHVEAICNKHPSNCE
jgi:hypothetical protein